MSGSEMKKIKNRKRLEGNEDSKYIAGSHTHCFPSDMSAVAANRDSQGHTSKSAKHKRWEYFSTAFLSLLRRILTEVQKRVNGVQC